ncbi:hypothetical protein FT663_00289 [Candidozyma haemuli var. vulneris]|nr:hypothetical protein FT662_00845 [[Candida] haemuloni var. vulneris]KAF3995542.1 hypothetical protein FT663_00289 [[Candida] haemuloni var. vulneris]
MYKQFLERFGLSVPIMQAPMAGVSTVAMAAEVAKAGGLGSLPMASVDLTKSTEPVFQQIGEFRGLAGDKAPVNVNFFAHDFTKQVPPGPAEQRNWYQVMARASGVAETKLHEVVPQFQRINISFKEFEHKQHEQVEPFFKRLGESNVQIVSFHFGLPSAETIDVIHRHKLAVFACVTSVSEAQVALDAGADVLVAQGYEAGGHRGNFLSEEPTDEKLPTKELFTQLAAKFGSSRVVPAGGIVDAAGAREYLDLGAAAVSMGTLFVTSQESSAPPYIGDLLRNKEDNLPGTVMTSLVSGKHARTVETPFINALVSSSVDQMPSYGYSYYAYKTAAKSFPPGCGFYLAGANYHKVTPGAKAGATVVQLWDEIQNNKEA